MRIVNRGWRQAAAVTAAACGSAIAVSFVLPAGAAMTNRPEARTVAAARPGSVCVVKATRYAVHSQDRVVTAAAMNCGATIAEAMTAAEAGPATKLVNVGYGCHRQNFSKKGTCWFFAVPSPGCVKNVAWIWGVLGVMKNDMKSWRAINSCHSGRVYTRPNLKGHFVTCLPSCRTLGRRVNDHDVSLKVGYGKKHP
jgi:hypothetical protein